MRLHRETRGDGERRVGFVHGLGADSASWRPLVDLLTATGSFTVTTVDLRGHGRSDRASRYRLEDFADDLVESLPPGLHSIVGHSLGGSVLVRAVGRLAPNRVIYLDPGFGLALPTVGLAGRLFWAVPPLTLGIAGARQARRCAPPSRLRLGGAHRHGAGPRRFDAKMATGVFHDVAFHPVPIGPPAVPSTIVLSDESPAVLPDAMAADLEREGWQIRRLRGVHHDMHLESPDRTFAAIEDLL